MPPDDDVVATGNVCLLSPNLGDVLPLDITGVVSLDVCGSGGLTDALITAGSSAKGIPPTNLSFAIVCTTTVNNEGWCDCGAGGASAAKDYSACRDSVAADGDDCDTTCPIVLSDDPGSSDNGPLRSAFSGTTGTGDCTGTLATAFKTVLLSPSQKGPGRKTDVTDAEWIAQLLQCGLV